jgi:hypothetical protein
MTPERMRYFHGAQQIQRASIVESVSTTYILGAADALTKAEAQAINTPGRKVPFTVQVNAKHAATYYVECLK